MVKEWFRREWWLGADAGDGGFVGEDDTAGLVESVIAEAYAPGLGPYDLATARNALAKVAVRMSRDRTRDLNWWQIPEWMPPGPRIVITAIAGALTAGVIAAVACGAALAIATGIQNGSTAGVEEFLPGGVLYGILFGITGGVAGLGAGWIAVRSETRPGSAREDGTPPPVIGGVRLAKALTRQSRRTVLRGGFAAALICGLVGGMVTGLVTMLAFGIEGGLVGGIVAAIVFGVWSALAIAVLLGIREALRGGPADVAGLDPVASWRENGRYGRAVGAWFGVLFGISAGVLFGIASGVHGLVFGIGFGLAVALTAGITAGLFNSRHLAVSLAAGWLAIRWGTPLRLVRFLKDAHDRGVLRVAGPAYQFRDPRLQDQLAATGRAS